MKFCQKKFTPYLYKIQDKLVMTTLPTIGEGWGALTVWREKDPAHVVRVNGLGEVFRSAIGQNN